MRELYSTPYKSGYTTFDFITYLPKTNDKSACNRIRLRVFHVHIYLCCLTNRAIETQIKFISLTWVFLSRKSHFNLGFRWECNVKLAKDLSQRFNHLLLSKCKITVKMLQCFILSDKNATKSGKVKIICMENRSEQTPLSLYCIECKIIIMDAMMLTE